MPKKLDRNHPLWIKKPYPHVWIVLFRYTDHEDFEVWRGNRGGLDLSAFKTRKEAVHECRTGPQYMYGKKNAYVKMYGPYS